MTIGSHNAVEPDQFSWLTEYLHSRGLLRRTRLVGAMLTGALALMPILMLFSPAGASGSVNRGLAVAAGAAGLMIAALLMWRWPTRRQSIVFVVVANVTVAIGCLVASDPMSGLMGIAVFSFLATYVAMLHSSRLLFATVLTASVTATAIALDLGLQSGDWILAGLKLALAVLTVLSVPFASQVMMRYFGTDVPHSDVDPLCNVLNRRGLYRRAGPLVDAAAQCGSELAVLLIDLDNFKSINDNYGHSAGDLTLVEVSRMLTRVCPETALICRSGGEEFLIADHGAWQLGVNLAERVCKAVATELRDADSGITWNVTASVGLVSGRPTRDRPWRVVFDDLVDAADAAMYDAKHAGGNRVSPRRVDLSVRHRRSREKNLPA